MTDIQTINERVARIKAAVPQAFEVEPGTWGVKTTASVQAVKRWQAARNMTPDVRTFEDGEVIVVDGFSFKAHRVNTSISADDSFMSGADFSRWFPVDEPEIEGVFVDVNSPDFEQEVAAAAAAAAGDV